MLFTVPITENVALNTSCLYEKVITSLHLLRRPMIRNEKINFKQFGKYVLNISYKKVYNTQYNRSTYIKRS